MTDSPDVILRRDGSAGRITLNRPKALNALTLGMVRTITPQLREWALDDRVELVLLDGAGDRALCAGGDVIGLYDARTQGSSHARAFWREEYALNALIARFPKPYVAFMDGIVMGGGIGLSAHGRHRIVTERSQLAMPETSIGLVPDVGGTWLLSRAPGNVGTYLGLTGERMRGAGTIFAGFADAFVPSGRLAQLAADLATARATEVGGIIARYSETPPPSNLAGQAALIERLFGHATVEEIRDALQREGGEWAGKVLADLAVRSPTALKATHEAIRRARGMTRIEDALAQEFLLCTHLYEDGEFIEGIRALLVDKDRKPRWRPDTLEAVTPARVAGLFTALADGDQFAAPA
jgi:enoyl-CoA hydratase